MEKHFLYPALIFAKKEPHIIGTILGSCVSVCLWDPVLKIGGMNHFLLPVWNGEGLATPKYGNIAIEKLIEKMESLGSKRRKLQAKIFGGASVIKGMSSTFNVGKRNVVLAEELLGKLGIPIVAQHVEGNVGRRINFQTNTGKVQMKKFREK